MGRPLCEASTLASGEGHKGGESPVRAEVRGRRRCGGPGPSKAVCAWPGTWAPGVVLPRREQAGRGLSQDGERQLVAWRWPAREGRESLAGDGAPSASSGRRLVLPWPHAGRRDGAGALVWGRMGRGWRQGREVAGEPRWGGCWRRRLLARVPAWPQVPALPVRFAQSPGGFVNAVFLRLLVPSKRRAGGLSPQAAWFTAVGRGFLPRRHSRSVGVTRDVPVQLRVAPRS